MEDINDDNFIKQEVMDDIVCKEENTSHNSVWFQTKPLSVLSNFKDLIEDNYSVMQSEKTSVVVVKIEKCDSMLGEDNILEPNIDITIDNSVIKKEIEGKDGNISHDSVWLQTKPLNVSSNMLMNSDEAVQLLCKVCGEVFYDENTYNNHSHETHNTQCGCVECNTQLAQKVDTKLHSQHSDTNKVWHGAFADYPHNFEIASPDNLELYNENEITISHDFSKNNKLKELTDETVTNLKILNYPIYPSIIHRSAYTKSQFIVGKDIENDKDIDHNKALVNKPITGNNVNLLNLAGNGKQTSNKQVSPREYFCDQCKYKCDRRSNLANHLKRHANEKPFSCKLCEFSCKDKSTLLNHTRVHGVEKPFACKLCEYTSKYRKQLVTHMKIHTGENPFTCKACQYACRDKRSLISHMRIHEGEKPFSCKLCDYASKYKNHLVSHMRIHTDEKPFTCKLCQYACREKSCLARHMRIHVDEKPFACKLCDYACRNKHDLLRHMRIHSDEKPFSCEICEYSCRAKCDLLSHMKTHSDEKPFSCTLCEYACKFKRDLLRHLRIHTGEKPFSCNLCQFACSEKRTLLNHMRVHGVEKPFLCKLCGYTCRFKSDLSRHKMIHTDEKLFVSNG